MSRVYGDGATWPSFDECINGDPATSVPTGHWADGQEEADLRPGSREWANAGRRNGPKRVDLPHLVQMRAGVGMRIGEPLALRWPEIELSLQPHGAGSITGFRG